MLLLGEGDGRQNFCFPQWRHPRLFLLTVMGRMVLGICKIPIHLSDLHRVGLNHLQLFFRELSLVEMRSC